MLFFSNKFISDDEREARSEREIGLFIKTRQDSTIRRKVAQKKKVKFAILLDGLFIYFSLVIEAFRISASLIPFLASKSELLLSSKSRSKDAT